MKGGRMGLFGNSNQPPIFCLKWPWIDHSHQNSTSPCNFDTPYVFKSLQTLAGLTANLFNKVANPSMNQNSTIKPSSRSDLSGSKINDVVMKKPLSKGLSREEQAEAEQRALAMALASGKEATVIEFYSPKCRLCNSLLSFVTEVEKRNSDWLNIVMADAENDKWLPELLHYDIKYVPCFIILDKNGRALAKTGVPSSRLHVVAGVSHLLKFKSPHRNHSNKLRAT